MSAMSSALSKHVLYEPHYIFAGEKNPIVIVTCSYVFSTWDAIKLYKINKAIYIYISEGKVKMMAASFPFINLNF